MSKKQQPRLASPKKQQKALKVRVIRNFTSNPETAKKDELYTLCRLPSCPSSPTMSEKSDSEEAETILRYMSKVDSPFDGMSKASSEESGQLSAEDQQQEQQQQKQQLTQKVLKNAKVSHKRLAMLIERSDELVE